MFQQTDFGYDISLNHWSLKFRLKETMKHKHDLEHVSDSREQNAPQVITRFNTDGYVRGRIRYDDTTRVADTVYVRLTSENHGKIRSSTKLMM